jgi:hypothetical protein
VKKLWLSASLQPDMGFVNSQNNVCGSYTDEPPPSFKCFDENGDEYIGFPEDGTVGEKRGNAVKGGPHMSTIRVLLGLDYLVAKNITVGGRLGYVIGAMPGRTLSSFHLEARATYWMGKNPFKKTALRPYVAAIGGLAEIDDKFTVTIRECQTADCVKQKPAGTYPNQQDLTVWHKAGGTFAGVAGGVMIPVGSKQGVMAELKVQGLFPNAGFAVSPSVGYALGF